MVLYLHHYTSKFESAVALRMKLIKEFKELVPDTLSFNVGYFEGQSHSKVWLVTREDFSTMYRKYPRGEVTLWCDARSEEEEDQGCRNKHKRDKGYQKDRKKKMRWMTSLNS